ncbi:hypothetical protein F5Y16DRAFT_406900 [Xylariaceae sp. FL0255]|nr:hypothetical protein F5Y16DRAFT_406900 [Xylariaceae sp. FL0255]
MCRLSNLIDVEEDTKARELICALSTLINFVRAGDALDPPDYAPPTGERMTVAVAQEILLQRWKAIFLEIDSWKLSLPPSFRPRGRTVDDHWNLVQEQNKQQHLSLFPRTWY